MYKPRPEEIAPAAQEAATPYAALRGPSWLNRNVLAWASYDIASSVYFGVVPTVLFPVFYVTTVDTSESRFFRLGAGVSMVLLLAGLVAPFLGRFADRSRWQWHLLAMFTFAYSISTAMLGFVGPGDALQAIALFAAAQSAYYLAQPLYESYLPAIAQNKDSGRASAFGWATGFLGGIAILVALLILVSGSDQPRFKEAFFLTGAVSLGLGIAALALMLRFMDRLPDEAGRKPAPVPQLYSWNQHGDLFSIIIAFYLVNIALVTISVFAAGYFNIVFGASLRDLLLLMLVYTIVALPSTMVFGVLADRFSHHGAILLSILVWTAAVALMAIGEGAWVPMTVAMCLGLVYGSTQSMFRSLVAQHVPRGREAEFFGLNTAAGRISASMGPVLYGAIATATEHPRWALFSMIAFALAGVAVLFASSKHSLTMGQR